MPDAKTLKGKNKFSRLVKPFGNPSPYLRVVLKQVQVLKITQSRFYPKQGFFNGRQVVKEY